MIRTLVFVPNTSNFGRMPEADFAVYTSRRRPAPTLQPTAETPLLSQSAAPSPAVASSSRPTPNTRDRFASIESVDSFATSIADDGSLPTRSGWLGRAAHLVSGPLLALWRLLCALWQRGASPSQRSPAPPAPAAPAFEPAPPVIAQPASRRPAHYDFPVAPVVIAGDARLPRQFAEVAFRYPATLMVPNADGALEPREVASLAAGPDCPAYTRALRQVGDWLTALCSGDAELTREVAGALSLNIFTSAMAVRANQPTIFLRPAGFARSMPFVPELPIRRASELVATPTRSGRRPGVVISATRHLIGPIELYPLFLRPTDFRTLEVSGALTQRVQFQIRRTRDGIVWDRLHASLSGDIDGRPLLAEF